MAEVIDYTTEKENTHFNGVPSMYGRIVDEQRNNQPMYAWPGDVDPSGAMVGDKRNEQKGP